ncbi:MAG: ATP-dependent Clp protease ATP-binding subunit [Ruminococcaceae bacterium]|nr:ATP-dependent Clp protease ATP-binding subunit [Oscillospiraceae bacterium]
MKLCSRCNKRPAILFINKISGDKVTSEGLCIQCAKELKIKPFSDYIEKMGLSDEDLEQLEEQMTQMMGELGEGDDTTTPALDLRQFLQGMNGGGSVVPSQPSEKRDKGSKEQKPDQEKKNARKMLSNFCLDLTQKAKNGLIDRIVGRDKELERVVQILSRRQKNNPCLIGEPGVGKTAIAEALAQKIVDGDVPYRLKNKEVFVLDLTALVAGTQFRGQFENRLRGLIEEVKKEGNIILVIDEVHTIVSAGDAEGGMNAGNILKPALSRGEIQVIGATTLTEYRKHIEKDQALERRFQPVMVKEPSVEQAIAILSGVKGYYEEFHGIVIPEPVVRRAVVMSERYIQDRYLPDKAIDLLDEAAARLSLTDPVINRIEELKDEISSVRAQREQEEQNTAPDDSVYARIADLKVSEMRLVGEYTSLTKERESIRLTEGHLADVIESWTDIPAANITENEFDRISNLDSKLKERIVGQDKAIDSVCRAIKRSRAGVAYKRKPVSFIFAGPTGVGKTELVKQLASLLFNSPEALIRLDMSEFMEKHAVSRIIGSPPGYVGYDDAGQLTEKIRRKPYSVILFDEIEKAHPDVMNILLQILDDGRISDAHGKEVNFENTVIIMTTNAGSNIKAALTGFNRTALEDDSEKTKLALNEFLRPEFINRVDEIITFNRLGIDMFRLIARIQLKDLGLALEEKGMKFEFDEDCVEHIAVNSFSEKYGARNVRRYMQTEVEDLIAEKIISAYNYRPVGVKLSLEGGTLCVDLSKEEK